VVLLAAACSESVGPSTPTVGPGGGTVSAAGGNVTLTFPPGAVSHDIAVTVQPASTSPSDPGVVVGTAYHFGPDGIQFAQPVLLSIKYESSRVPAGVQESSLKLYKVVGDSWRQIAESHVNSDSKVVTAQINGFSTLGILGSPLAVSRVDGGGAPDEVVAWQQRQW